MTKEEIMAIKAGRELDELVAEVFGDIFQHPYLGKLYHQFKGENEDYGWHAPAPVSTDITAAWLVLQRLLDQKFRVELLAIPNNGKHACYCDIMPSEIGGADERTGLIPADTMPEAICKAALLAKR